MSIDELQCALGFCRMVVAGKQHEGCVAKPQLCKYCGRTFISRTQLFKHLRDGCQQAPLDTAFRCQVQLKPDKLALLIGFEGEYFSNDEGRRYNNAARHAHSKEQCAESAANVIGRPLEAALCKAVAMNNTMGTAPNANPDTAPASISLESLAYSACARTNKGSHGSCLTSCLNVSASTLRQHGGAAGFARGLQCALPPEMRILAAAKAPRLFNPRAHCEKRVYEVLLPLRALIPPVPRNCDTGEEAKAATPVAATPPVIGLSSAPTSALLSPLVSARQDMLAYFEPDCILKDVDCTAANANVAPRREATKSFLEPIASVSRWCLWPGSDAAVSVTRCDDKESGSHFALQVQHSPLLATRDGAMTAKETKLVKAAILSTETHPASPALTLGRDTILEFSVAACVGCSSATACVLLQVDGVWLLPDEEYQPDCIWPSSEKHSEANNCQYDVKTVSPIGDDNPKRSKTVWRKLTVPSQADTIASSAAGVHSALSGLADVGGVVDIMKFVGRSITGLGLLVLTQPPVESGSGIYRSAYSLGGAIRVGYVRVASLSSADIAAAEFSSGISGGSESGNTILNAGNLPPTAALWRLPLLRRIKPLLKMFEGTHSWHNFTNGIAPTEHTATRRLMRCTCCSSKLVGDTEVVVLRLTARRFLFAQIASIMGAVTAIMRGALPISFVQIALRPDIVLCRPIPPIPQRNITLHAAHFDRAEAKSGFIVRPRANILHVIAPADALSRVPQDKGGKNTTVSNHAKDSVAIEQSDICERTAAETPNEDEILGSDGAAIQIRDWRSYLHSVIVTDKYRELELWIRGDLTDAAPLLWADALEQSRWFPASQQNVSSSAQRQLKQTFDGDDQIDNGTSKVRAEDQNARTPSAYREVLRLLREADHSGRWPRSSTKRQALMHPNPPSLSSALTTADQQGRAGSITLGTMPPPLRQPHANALFPELLRAARALELALLPTRARAPSSTIVLNRHAQFKPHKDSGAGEGQGLSAIVALGEFTGGELVVEGKVHPIRYKPLVFNGWEQRHWTRPFAGERYSIVWFSPLGVGQPASRCSAADTDTDRALLRLSPSLGPALDPAKLAAPSFNLHGGTQLPLCAFGTFHLRGEPCAEAVLAALRAGVRCIDTAASYKNGSEISNAVISSGLERSDLCIISKVMLPAGAASAADAERMVRAAALHIMRELQVGVDVLLLHWPGGITASSSAKDTSASLAASCGTACDGCNDSNSACDGTKLRRAGWTALRRLRDEGRVRSIGVSNFEPCHLSDLLDSGVPEMDEAPCLNQVECHPMLQQAELRAVCARHGILLQAHTCLGRAAELLGHPTVIDAAAAAADRSPGHECLPPSVVLRWHMARRMPFVFGSHNPEHIAQNAQACTDNAGPLCPRAALAMDGLDCSSRVSWDPRGIC